MENKYTKIVLTTLFLLVLIASPVMACNRHGHYKRFKNNFDEYGYNERATLFKGCLTNYYNWKYNRPAIECSETDMKVFSNWRFDRQKHLRSLLNVLYEPQIYKMTTRWYRTFNQSKCLEREGTYMGLQTVTQTGEVVPLCKIREHIKTFEPKTTTLVPKMMELNIVEEKDTVVI